MKKNVLALSITAALVGFGFAGSAQAIGLATTSGNPIPAGAATSLRTSVDGIGQFLLVPYFTAQGSNNTMINIVNTDTVNGKAVKVRFRGAANSDDLFDFQVFLSPGDVWTTSVAKALDGTAHMTTTDLSCTKPAKATLNATAFSTIRVDPNLNAAGMLNETREGYVEIFNMADIPPTIATGPNPLFTAIKHVAGAPNTSNTAPPCGTTTATKPAWDALDLDPLNAAAANLKGLFVPTTGLFANWIILNSVDAGAWSGAAPAIFAADEFNAATTGAITYFPQTNEALGVTASRLAQFTADPVLIANPSMAAAYDLPDFSIPYTGAAAPATQAALLSQAIATTKVINEYLTPSAISAHTDWVLSMPTRRYSVAYDYQSTATDGRVYTLLSPEFFNAGNTALGDHQVCVIGTTYTAWDREETTPGLNSGVIVSPQLPGSIPNSFPICGEASVVAFNSGETAAVGHLIMSVSGALQATVARSSVDATYSAGWFQLNTPGILGNGLPIVGYEAVKAVGAAGGQAFGATLPHRTDRVQK
jgi:hypothetical protein